MAKRLSPNSFKSVSDIIYGESGFSGLRETIKNFDVVEAFGIIFPELKQIALAVKVEKKTLFLKVDNSVWKCELNLKKNLLIEKVNRFFKDEVVKSIKFL
jgi:hypothetical protein